MAYTSDSSARYYDADGAKIIEKDVRSKLRTRTWCVKINGLYLRMHSDAMHCVCISLQ